MDTVSGFPEAQGVCAREARTGWWPREETQRSAISTNGTALTFDRTLSTPAGEGGLHI